MHGVYFYENLLSLKKKNVREILIINANYYLTVIPDSVKVEQKLDLCFKGITFSCFECFDNASITVYGHIILLTKAVVSHPCSQSTLLFSITLKLELN